MPKKEADYYYSLIINTDFSNTLIKHFSIVKFTCT